MDSGVDPVMEALKFAYADPPYIGQAKKHYSRDPNCSEVNHRILINTMCENYNGWALSCSSPSLQQILALCPSDVRVMAWVKPFCAFKVNVNPAYAWEPVIVWHPRPRTRQQITARDWVSAPITFRKGLPGAKPESFCFWLFEVLNLQFEDSLDDLFPGTGIVTNCLERWKAQIPLPLVFSEAYCEGDDVKELSFWADS